MTVMAKFSALQKSKGTASLLLWCGGTSLIHKLDINLQDPYASIDIPDDMCDANILRLQLYMAAINAVLSKQNKFTDVMARAICGEKHSFKDCKTLLDFDFLRKHFIAYCLQWKCTHRQITTAVHRLEAAALADANDQDTVSDNSDTPTNDDNEQNFCAEGE